MNLSTEEIALVSNFLSARPEVKQFLFTLNTVLGKKKRPALKKDGTPRARPGRKPKAAAVGLAALLVFLASLADVRGFWAFAQEQGITDFDVPTWTALFLPKGTPDPIVERLAVAMAEVSVPLVAVKSEPAVALTPAVAKSTVTEALVMPERSTLSVTVPL